jgi:hypothetical protein
VGKGVSAVPTIQQRAANTSLRDEMINHLGIIATSIILP